MSNELYEILKLLGVIFGAHADAVAERPPEKNITEKVTLLEKRKLDECDRKKIPQETRQPLRRKKNAPTG